MVLCPVALAVGNVCPVKGVIGDYRPDAPNEKASGGKKKS
jgi:hypothetical protein